MRNAGLEEAQTGIKIAGRNINKLRYNLCRDTFSHHLRRLPTKVTIIPCIQQAAYASLLLHVLFLLGRLLYSLSTSSYSSFNTQI